MREKIIEFLKKKEDYFSGDELSQKLGISRQALWKHIQELKESGYEIVAVPHLGYKLEASPDRLFDFEVAQGLDTKFIGHKIHYFDSVSSTMDAAVELGMKGCLEGTIVLTEGQTKGRGRMGRIWFSPKYKGIYLSLILRPKIMPNQAPVLTLLTAVAVCEAIMEFTGIEAQIKWPNDIFIKNKKLGGILTELNAETDRVRFIVIGMGLNVNNDKKALISGATSLKEQKDEPVSRVGLLQEILRKLEDNYLLFQAKGASIIIKKWREHSLTLGKRVKVYCQKEHIEGEAFDIDVDGGLLIRKDSGMSEKVMSGDVIHAR